MTAEAAPYPQGISIDAFDPQKHDRKSFTYGVDRLDNFLKYTAKKQQAGDYTRVRVVTYSGQTVILDYYALNAHFLDVGNLNLPIHLAKNTPRSDCIPNVYLSMIAVAQRYQGRGIGHTLLWSALNRARIAADEVGIGIKAVILDVIEDGGAENTAKRRAFYEGAGFPSIPSCPLRMLISIETVRNTIRIGS